MSELLNCHHCSKILHEMPRINVEGIIYCFTCAKKVVREKEKALQDIAHHKHIEELQKYESEEKEYKTLVNNLNRDCEEYVQRNPPKLYLLKLSILVVCCLIFYFIIDIAWWLIFPVIAYAYKIYGDQQYKANELTRSSYWSQHIKPTFDVAKPIEHIVRVSHHPVFYGDDKPFTKLRYRHDILKRDRNVCQNCEKKKDSKELEVHHVIPVVSGGLDSPYNLVTLCKYCHDRETWYGHVRIYATTKERFDIFAPFLKKRRRRF